MHLNDPITTIPGIGPTRAKALEKLNIRTLKDALLLLPHRYEDRRSYCKISELESGKKYCVEAMVATSATVSHIRKGLDLCKFRAVDETGVLEITCFNQSFLKNSIQQGETYIFYGTAEGNLLKKKMTNPIIESPRQQTATGAIIPVYSLTHGLTQKMISHIIRTVLENCLDELADCLPYSIRTEHQLVDTQTAYREIHLPSDETSLNAARQRFVFEELFLMTLGMQLIRKRREILLEKPLHAVSMGPFYDALPFALTNAQKRAIEDAVHDMTSGRPMNRLVQGDVGSGKTMVAAACIYFAVQNGYQAVMMAPTEILAHQHYEGLLPLFHKLGIQLNLFTGSATVKERKQILSGLTDGTIQCCIGTHALLSDKAQYQNLGLVITDEQHRFGVEQRSKLAEKANIAHILVMSATPIPRTLALLLYGDLDVSVIDELPPGRQVIDTYSVNSSYHPRLYEFARNLIKEGRQVFIVCPLVEENDEIPDDRKAVTVYAEQLQKEIFPEYRVAAIHGKMKAAEKDSLMNEFLLNKIQILVSTTVIEVGVDVPNAALMLIENAERFGFSQLHQLRGRVGRGKHKSYCVLVSDAENEEAKQRFRIMTKTNNGFRIAEEDLKLRGPGDFFGERQHGLPGLHIADLSADMETLMKAQKAAQVILKKDPDLSSNEHRVLKSQVEVLFQSHQNSMN